MSIPAKVRTVCFQSQKAYEVAVQLQRLVEAKYAQLMRIYGEKRDLEVMLELGWIYWSELDQLLKLVEELTKDIDDVVALGTQMDLQAKEFDETLDPPMRKKLTREVAEFLNILSEVNVLRARQYQLLREMAHQTDLMCLPFVDDETLLVARQIEGRYGERLRTHT